MSVGSVWVSVWPNSWSRAMPWRTLASRVAAAIRRRFGDQKKAGHELARRLAVKTFRIKRRERNSQDTTTRPRHYRQPERLFGAWRRPGYRLVRPAGRPGTGGHSPTRACDHEHPWSDTTIGRDACLWQTAAALRS